MAEALFQRLAAEERRHALRAAQAECPHPAFVLEKDIWVVATLGVLFDAPFGPTGEPHAAHAVVCDAAPYLPDLTFPEARPAVMLAERTFWEKATSMHVHCLQGRRRGERWSRHWHDLARLDDAGIAARALADRELALSVARHKAMFFRENDSGGQRIDYEAAVSGSLRLVPSGAAQEVLANDYASMVASGMLLDEDEPFGTLMERCAIIEARANAPLRPRPIRSPHPDGSRPRSMPVPRRSSR